MSAYAVDGSQAVASPTDTVLTILATTAVRPEIFYMIFGSTATPADNALQFLVQRFTAGGTGTSVTPEPLDSSDVAAVSLSAENHTTEPTYTAGKVLLNVPMHQRGTYQWYSRDRGGFKAPATAANGIGVQPVHASFSGQVEATAHFDE